MPAARNPLRSSKHEACLKNAARLICIQTSRAKNRTWRGVGRVNNGEVPAKEERIFAIGWCDSESKRPTARAIHQVDGSVREASGTLDVFRPGGEGKAAAEVVG